MTLDCQYGTYMFGSYYTVPTYYHERMAFLKKHEGCRGKCKFKK